MDWLTDDAERDDGWEAADTDVGDRQLRKSRVCSSMCGTCVFRPEQDGRLHGITNHRVRDLIARARQAEGYIVCHATLGTPAPAICRGFYDRYSTNALRVMRRLWGFVEVNPPATKGHRP